VPLPVRAADTIVAVATPTGRGAIGIVRLSGPDAFGIAEALTGRASPGRAMRRVTAHASDGAPIDDGVALWFPDPASYTGEPVFEFQGHGSPVAMAAIVERCLAQGARLARPGEFTERAFLNGKLDLLQAEAVADVIDAASTRALRAARQALQGQFSAPITDLRARLIELRVLAEAALDFPEEELDVLREQQVRERVARLADDASGLVERARRGRVLRDGVTVALVGAPNVGKSSLVNALAGSDVALVTDIPGTTRDVVRAEVILGGVHFRLLDTAGRRASDDPIERMGIARGQDAASAADLVVEVRDASASEPAGTGIGADLAVDLMVLNKIDRIPHRAADLATTGVAVAVSALTGDGLDALRERLVDLAGAGDLGAVEAVTANARQHASLAVCAAALAAGRDAPPGYPELLAEHLREADDALGVLLGVRRADDLLGDIFGRFCIGK
jgi:tRNA modification GTPase